MLCYITCNHSLAYNEIILRLFETGTFSGSQKMGYIFVPCSKSSCEYLVQNKFQDVDTNAIDNVFVLLLKIL